MFERFRSGSRAGSQAGAASGTMPAPAIRALEPRFVFDGAAAPAAAQAHGDAAAQAHGDAAAQSHGDTSHAEAADKSSAAPVAAAPGHETASTNGRHEIVVIDKGVADLKTLLAGVPASAEVILINSGTDGFDQLAKALEGRSDIDAIHILSHGKAGDLHLGTGELTAESIQGRYAADLAIIGRALTATGDLLIYGCDFAAGETGARAAALLAKATGADVAASDDATGAAALGGDWDLEVHDGPIETGVVLSEAAQRDWNHLLAAADNGRGALLAVAGQTIYSIDIATGKATALTTAPASVGGITLSGGLNSLAVDQANGLIYYVDGAADTNNKALFAYDFVNDQHILIKSDLTQGAAGSTIVTGSQGLGQAGAAFSAGTLYLAVENVSGNTDQIYKLTFSNNGRTVSTAATFGNQSNHDFNWGDITIDPVNNQLVSLTSVSFARFDLATGNELSFVSGSRTDFQAGFDQGGLVYSVGTDVTQIDPTTGAAIGSGKVITTNGSTALANIADAASWTPPTSSISGRVFADANANGVSNSGEGGIQGVTVELVDDVNGNGVVDTGERVLATDTSAANGGYSFTGILPGQYIVRVTDADGRLTTATATTPTRGSVTDTKVGATLAGPDFGYNPALVLDLDESAAGTGYATSYTERATGVAIVDSDVTIMDVAKTTLSSARAVITNGSTGDTLSIAGTLPPGITATYDTATYTLTLAGTASLADYQTALQQIRFSSAEHDPSTVTRAIAVSLDDGSTTSNTASSRVAFTAVDDAPVNTVPAGQTVSEDTPLVFSSGNGNAITISDADARSGTLTTTLGVTHGTITLGSTSGVTVSGNGTGAVTLTGTVAAINAALDGTRYQGTRDYNGADTLTVTTNDNGNTGTGGPLSDSDTVAITVTPVNDAPVLDLDGSAAGTGYATSYTEHGAGVAIVDADISVSDVDNANIASATAVITNFQAGDSLGFAGSPPAGITASYDAATHTLTLTGSASKADYQTALQQIRYSSTGQNPSTVTRSIAVTVSDGALDSNTAVTSIAFTAVNDPPVNAVPGGQSVAEDTPLVFSSGNGNAISISDPDAQGGSLTTTLGVLHGTLTLGSTSGVTVSGNGTGTVTLTGTAAAINAALDGTRYQGAQDYNGAETLTVTTNDNGNTGSGGAQSDSDTVAITITPVNDAPVNRLPAPQAVDEDTNLVFSSGNGNAVSISDVDAGGGALTTTISVQHGTLTLGGTANLTVTGNGTGTVTLTGTVADINAALDGTTYRGSLDYNGADTLSIVTDDNGNTGAGGALTDSDTLALTVRAVQDPPRNSVPAATQVVDEDTPLVFSGANGNAVSVADPDGGTLTVTLSSAEGLLSLSRTAGLTFLQGDGSRDATLRFTGTIADINAALEGLRFDPNADANGAAQIMLATQDPQGAVANSSIALSITPVADIVPDAVATNEDTPVTFNALTGANGGSADNFESPAAYVSSVTQGAHGSVSFQADGTMTYTPDPDFNGADSFTYTVTSGGTTETATVSVTVRAVNDAPVLDLAASAAGTGYATSYTERAPGVAIVAADVAASDVDSAAIASARAVIANGSGGDTLSIAGTLPAGITAVFDPATYTLTLTGSATRADYQTALQQIRFSSADRDPSTATRTIDVSVNDGTLDSNVATATVAFTAVNDAPVNGLPAAQTLAEDTPLVFSAANGNAITVADADARNGTLTTTIGVGHGTLTLGATGGVTVSGDGTGTVTLTGTLAAINAALDGTTYRPAADYNGGDTLTILTNDNGNTGSGGPLSDSDALALTVTPVNDAPRAGLLPSIGSLDGDAVAGTDLGRYFSDVEGDTLRFGAVGLPPGLAIDPATGIVSGTIDRSASRQGDYAVTVTADDGNGGLTSRSFTWRVVDPAPVARNDGAVTDAATPATGSVLADNGNGPDSDPDGDPLSVSAVNGAAGGVGRPVTGSAGGTFTVLADGSYRFDPGADFADLASGQTRTTRITYTVSDGDGGFAQATLAVTVTGRAAAPPALAPDDRAARDGDTVAFQLDGLFPNPSGQSRGYGATGLPPGLSIDPATGAVTGTIDRAASGAAGLADYRVTVTATDPQGGSTTRAFTLRVTNPAPRAVDDAATTAEDTPVAIDVLANDTDPDGDTLTIVATGDAAPSAGHGQVAVVNGRLVYTPDANFNGTDTITYTIADGNGGTSTASVTVTVSPVDDAPQAGTLPDQYGRDGAPVSYDISGRFRDPDPDPSVVQAPSGDRLTYGATGLPPGLSIDPATGVISGTLPSDASAVSRYTVTVTATDAAGANVARSFTWTVSNGAPIAAPDTATTPAGRPVLVAVTANDVDPDGDALRLVDEPGAASAAHGSVSVDPATGLLTYTPQAGFSGRDTIVYTIEDAQGERATGILTVTVTPENQRPTAPDTLPARNAADGQPVSLPLGTLFRDPDGGRLAYYATGLPPGLTIDPVTGAVSGTIDRAASGPGGSTTYVVTLTATDPGGLAVSRNLVWTVTNPAPDAVDDAVTTPEDTALDIDVTSNDTDPDGDTLTVVPGSATAGHGTVTLNPDGTLRYVPDRDFNGTDHILYTITDGNGGFATATVTITVTAVNDAPVVDPSSPALADVAANDAQAVSIPAGGAFGDVDTGDRLSFAATGLPPGLSIDPATGLISGTIASDASTRVPGGVYTVTLTGTDLAGASALVQLTITVANPAPIALDDAASVAEDTVLTGNVLGNDRDPDGDALRVDPVPVAGPAHGRLELNPDGSFTYTPDADFHGTDAFTYALVDSDGGRTTATVRLTIGEVNDAPTGSAEPLTLPANTSASGRIAANDRDGDDLSFRLADPPANGTVALAPDGSYVYRPYAAYSGADRFTVEVSDGNGGSVLVDVEITVTPNPVQVPPMVFVPGLLPPEPFVERPAAPPISAISADGFVLTAVAGIDSLNSIGDVILADGAVVAAVNGVAPLHGIALDIDRPVIMQEADRIARLAWDRFDDTPVDETPWFSPRPYLGRSLGVSLALDGFGSERSDLMVEAIRRPDLLSINLRGYDAALQSVAGVRILGLDGAPPPDWIEGDGMGAFWGRPPAGTGLVRFELEIERADGQIVRRPLSVDAETGEIRALPASRPTVAPQAPAPREPEPDTRSHVPLFTTRLAALDTRQSDNLRLIERALAPAR